jgi:hypothetical protein
LKELILFCFPIRLLVSPKKKIPPDLSSLARGKERRKNPFKKKQLFVELP